MVLPPAQVDKASKVGATGIAIRQIDFNNLKKTD